MALGSQIGCGGALTGGALAGGEPHHERAQGVGGGFVGVVDLIGPAMARCQRTQGGIVTGHVRDVARAEIGGVADEEGGLAGGFDEFGFTGKGEGFLNRIDDIVVFHALSRAQLKAIVDIQLGRLRQLLSARRISLELSENAKDLLVAAGDDPAFGARPLKRVLQHRIADPLALELLQGKIQDGDHVVVDTSGDELTFTRLEVLPA